MTIPTIITIFEKDLQAGWNWVQSEASVLFNEFSTLIGPALKNFEATVVQGFWGAAVTIVQKLLVTVQQHTPLADLETQLLNTLSSLGQNFLAAAAALGSTVMQAILGALQVKLSPPAAAA